MKTGRMLRSSQCLRTFKSDTTEATLWISIGTQTKYKTIMHNMNNGILNHSNDIPSCHLAHILHHVQRIIG